MTDDDGPGAAALVRPSIDDMFRLGSTDVLTERRTVTDFSGGPADPVAVRRAIEVALTAPAPGTAAPAPGDASPGDVRPWRFAVAESAAARQRVVDAMAARSPDGRDQRSAGQGAGDRRGLPSRARHAHRTALLISLGAAVENLLVALAVDGLGSCWVLGPESFGPAVADALDLPAGWEPIGAIGVGHPAGPPPEHRPLTAT